MAAMRANSLRAKIAADRGAAPAAADQADRQRGIGLRAAHRLRLQDREAERRGGRRARSFQKITAAGIFAHRVSFLSPDSLTPVLA